MRYTLLVVRRVLVIGCGGSGKSTLARQLGDKTGLPVIHLDQHYWRAGWVETPPDEWHRVLDELARREAWIMDGNYGESMEQRLAACDAVVFLDLPRRACVAAILARWWRLRGRARPDVAPGCPERLSWEFFVWVWTYRRARRPDILARLAALDAGKRVFILRSRREAARFVDEVLA